MVKLLLGADPEVFVKNMDLNKFVSAHGMVNGTKASPEPCELGAYQVDGMALEFNITPAASREEFLKNIQTVYGSLQERIGGQYSLVPVPHVIFESDIFKAAPEEAKELGCDPDFNAWQNGEANPRPNNTTAMRTGAGHVHIGWTEGMDVQDPDHLEACCMLTKQLDASLGLAAMYWDKDGKRRTMYGAAGAFRPKPYGMEYRVMSNAWLTSEELIGYVYDAAIHATKDLLAGNKYYRGSNTIGGLADRYQTEYYSHTERYNYYIRSWLIRLNKENGFPLPWKS